MTTCTPGLPVSERALWAFGHHRPSKKGASLRKEGAIFGESFLIRTSLIWRMVTSLDMSIDIYVTKYRIMTSSRDCQNTGPMTSPGNPGFCPDGICPNLSGWCQAYPIFWKFCPDGSIRPFFRPNLSGFGRFGFLGLEKQLQNIIEAICKVYSRSSNL